MIAEGPARPSRVLSPESGALSAAQSGAERSLADTLDRALRHPADKIALVLHLSRLSPPAPYPHHLRVAHALMQDCGQRFNGQVFILPAQDMVLVATMPREPLAAALADSPVQLRETLSRLFASDMPDPVGLTSFWRLDEDPRAFGAYLGGATAMPGSAPAGGAAPPATIPASPRCLVALEKATAQAPIGDTMVQQTGMFLDADRKLPMDLRLKPAFRELRVALRLLNLKPPATDALGDPYLRQHFNARLDLQVLQVLQEDLQVLGRLSRGAAGGALPLHVGLGLDAILSTGFARLARLAQETGVRFAVQVSLMQTVLGIDMLAQARKLLDAAGFEFTVGPVDGSQLGIAAPHKLNPHAVRLVWSPHLAALVADKQSAAARNFAAIAAERLILHAVDSEQAVAWGQTQGIGRFQGRFVDLVQAATRMSGCFAAANCTLRQCAERAGSLSNAGRTGCLNRPLLDTPALKTA